MTNILRSVVCFAIVSTSCGPTPKASGVSRVGAADLVAHVRDHGDQHYRGQRVQVRIPARTYRVEGGHIHYFTGLPGAKPVIVFACREPQETGNVDHLIVTGIVRGAVQDGERKGDRITFHIRVEECVVTRYTE